MVADFDEVGTRGWDVEPQGRVFVLSGGQQASVDVVEPHLVAVGTFHNDLSALLVEFDVKGINVADALLRDVDGVADVDGVVDVDGVGRKGDVDGVAEGDVDGVVDGDGQGVVDGHRGGVVGDDGGDDGVAEGDADRVVDGNGHGVVDDDADGVVNDAGGGGVDDVADVAVALEERAAARHKSDNLNQQTTIYRIYRFLPAGIGSLIYSVFRKPMILLLASSEAKSCKSYKLFRLRRLREAHNL